VTSSLRTHLASYLRTAAGSRALAGHLRDDHGMAVCTSSYEGHAVHSAMPAAANEAAGQAAIRQDPANGRVRVHAATPVGEVTYELAGEAAGFVHVAPVDVFTYRGRRYGGTVLLVRGDFSLAGGYAWILIGGRRRIPAPRDVSIAISAAVWEAVATHVAAHPEAVAEGICAAARFRAGQVAGQIATAEKELARLRAEHARLLEATRDGQPVSGQDREPPAPAYLRGVLTVEAELSAGHTGPHGGMRTDATSPVLVALSYVDGTASLVTEDGSGQLTRLRIPGWAFLRLTDGAERKLAASREQSGELR
jgi:hypothetical protein